MSKELGHKFLNLVSEAVVLKAQMASVKTDSYRYPLWYEENQERLGEIESELGELLSPAIKALDD